MEMYDVARDLLLDLIQRNPLMISAYDKLAEVYERTGDLEAAVDVLQEATAKSPLGIPRQMKLGRVATQNRKYDVAGGAYQKSIVLGRRSCYRSPEPFLRLANIRRLEMASQEERTKIATTDAIEQLLTLAISKFPRDQELKVRASLLKAEVAHENGKPELAEKHRAQAETYNSELDFALDLQRELLDVKGDQVPMLEQDQTHKPRDAMLQSAQDPAMSHKINRQGIKQYLAGKLVQAIKHFTLAADYDRNNAAAVLNLAQVFMEAARDNRMNRDERLKMAGRYLVLSRKLDLEPEERDRAELLKGYLDRGLKLMPEGSLATLLR